MQLAIPYYALIGGIAGILILYLLVVIWRQSRKLSNLYYMRAEAFKFAEGDIVRPKSGFFEKGVVTHTYAAVCDYKLGKQYFVVSITDTKSDAEAKGGTYKEEDLEVVEKKINSREILNFINKKNEETAESLTLPPITNNILDVSFPVRYPQPEKKPTVRKGDYLACDCNTYIYKVEEVISDTEILASWKKNGDHCRYKIADLMPAKKGHNFKVGDIVQQGISQYRYVVMEVNDYLGADYIVIKNAFDDKDTNKTFYNPENFKKACLFNSGDFIYHYQNPFLLLKIGIMKDDSVEVWSNPTQGTFKDLKEINDNYKLLKAVDVKNNFDVGDIVTTLEKNFKYKVRGVSKGSFANFIYLNLINSPIVGEETILQDYYNPNMFKKFNSSETESEHIKKLQEEFVKKTETLKPGDMVVCK